MNQNDNRDFWDTLWREALRAMSLGWELAVPIFAGVFFGHLLDLWLNTGYVFTLGLLMFGIMIAYYNLARTIRRMAEHEKMRKIKTDEKENNE
jgi:F0F1-type ATP synthase assembly protein I